MSFLQSCDKRTFVVDKIVVFIYFAFMNTNLNDKADRNSTEVLSASLAALKAANLAAATQHASLPSPFGSKEEKIYNPPEGEMTGFQHLKAGTEPVQSRDEAGTHAGTANVPPSPKNTRPNPATHSKLDDLPPEVYAKLLRLIETKTFDEAIDAATAPRPHGLGIQTSRSSLERLAKRHRASLIARQRDDSAAALSEILKNAAATDEEFARAAVHLMRFHLLRHAMAERTDDDKMLMLSRVLDRLRAADFAERRLRLAESKLQKTEPKSP
jgi:hypothetical protein